MSILLNLTGLGVKEKILKELVGKVIDAIAVNEDQQLIKFTINTGDDIIYSTVSDCCSETWWADILAYDWSRLFPFSVDIEQCIELPLWASTVANSDGKSRQEYDQIYGHALTSVSGRTLEIIYRNSSNGYYGGDYKLIIYGENHYYDELLKNSEWTNITSDWTA